MSKTTSAKGIRKRHRAIPDQQEEAFSLASTMAFLEKISGNESLSASFSRFSLACDELEKSGLSLEDAVMAKLAIDAGFAGYSTGDKQDCGYPWEACLKYSFTPVKHRLSDHIR